MNLAPALVLGLLSSCPEFFGIILLLTLKKERFSKINLTSFRRHCFSYRLRTMLLLIFQTHGILFFLLIYGFSKSVFFFFLLLAQPFLNVISSLVSSLTSPLSKLPCWLVVLLLILFLFNFLIPLSLSCHHTTKVTFCSWNSHWIQSILYVLPFLWSVNVSVMAFQEAGTEVFICPTMLFVLNFPRRLLNISI